ncbi:MAG: hypothetical protein H6Q48_4154 [Deltaproteobacteria bacterium]|nr:hypothetical protein [Deltaproteobacteria bacterium]
MARVALLKCEDYDSLLIRGKMVEALDLIGLEPGIFAGKRVVIKPNLLSATAPEKSVVTHPEFFRAAVRMVRHHGGKPILCESPGFQPLAKVMKKAGYDRIAEEEGCEIADPRATGVLFYDGPCRFKRFEISSAVFDADFILNLPKFKTHALTYITGAVKNLFGLIYGLNKAQWHLKARSKEEFSGFLLDYYSALLGGFEKPKVFIHLMDAIMGMEGEGPGVTGTPRKIGAILAGQDAVSVDAVATRVVGLRLKEVLTVTLGDKRELGTGAFDRIDIEGAGLDEFQVRDYVPSKAIGRSPGSRWPLSTKVFKDLLVEKPVPSRERCTLCYQCKAICPGGAISESKGESGIPRYDYDKCIRCYCCMEICPEAAIGLKRGKLQWLVSKWTK